MWKNVFKKRMSKGAADAVATPTAINQGKEHAEVSVDVEKPVQAADSTMTPRHDDVSPESCDDDGLYVVANFTGLVVLQGATEKRQIRYVMEIVCPSTRQKCECVKRFDQFIDLRHRVMDTLKKCRSKTCSKCVGVAAIIHAQPFPGRHLFTTLHHVRDRALPLEAFLQCILDSAFTWKGCKRARHAFSQVVSQFVGAPVDSMVSNRSNGDRPPPLDFRKSIRHLMVERQESVGGGTIVGTSDVSSSSPIVPEVVSVAASFPEDIEDDNEQKEDEGRPDTIEPATPIISTDEPVKDTADDESDDRIERS
ncbi:hypothetical protein DYB26_006658 [Aphanomyces astaci]|uniref:PX domain-containing protein n=1 Tax=Aphanomyces astaci TaxID=112090 RepID=A0A397C0A0_APHAT|nr:hypothetical protein DYB38_003859 [Aphanomyces astaci]RHY98972.1 hypothetical protein DYB26_006658 [Aphanomyces astaci]